MIVKILSVAKLEVEEASDYYESQREGLGHEFVLAFEQTLKAIQAFPGLGSRSRKTVVDDALRDFPMASCSVYTKGRYCSCCDAFTTASRILERSNEGNRVRHP